MLGFRERVSYLEMMEWLAAVQQQKAFLTKEGLGKTVDTTERGLRCHASNTLRKARQKRG